jgi:hypothetical protein
MRHHLATMRRDLTTILLFAAMISPVVAPLLGWSPVTPLGVPLGVHLLLLAAIAAVGTRHMWRRGARPTGRQVIEWIAGTVLAVAGALVLQLRSNAFYTASTLVDGMALLLLIHLCVRGIRRTTRDDRSPAVWVADELTGAVGWAVLASWLLIWLEHRHIAGVILIIAGTLQTLALIVLIPDAVAGLGWLSRKRILDKRRVR